MLTDLIRLASILAGFVQLFFVATLHVRASQKQDDSVGILAPRVNCYFSKDIDDIEVWKILFKK